MYDLKLCIVEDDINALNSLKELLSMDGYSVFAFDNPLEAFQFLKNNEIDIVISDIKMPEMSGIKLLEKIKDNFHDIDVILMTAFGDVNNAVEAVKKGASDYILKPINYDELLQSIKKIEEIRKLKYIVNLENKDEIEIIANSPLMKEVLKQIEYIAPTDSTVLIEGETGVGKELIARLIHKKSKRKNNQFIPVNCAAIPKDLLEAELFGFEKGSFTGATKPRKGKFILADKGTIFLDEISEMDIDLQAKFLRVLEDGVIEKIGSEIPFKSDVRIIAATNKNLEELVKQNKFRSDIYFRLNVCKIKIPPLRERKEDLEPLIKYFLKIFSKKYEKNIKGITENALKKLKNYSFPGNIRELKHIIERAVITTNSHFIEDKNILLSNLNEKISDENIKIPYNITLKEAEKIIILETLKKNNYNKRKTAEILGISVRKIELKLKEWGLTLNQIKYSA